MKIFVLGTSGSGKTPIARNIATFYGLTYIPASAWVKKIFPVPETYFTMDDRAESASPKPRQAYTNAITQFSLARLKENPAACIDYLTGAHNLTLPSVIDGIRNPFDFINLFDSKNDIAVVVTNAENVLTPTLFEKKGLSIIQAYLDYLQFLNLLKNSSVQIVHVEFGEYFLGANTAIKQFLGRTGEWIDAHCLKHAAAEKIFVHANIPKITTFVKNEFLYNMDAMHASSYTPCTIFAVSSYTSFTPTFKILLENGSVFSFIPPHALYTKIPDCTTPLFELSDLVYHNCKAPQIMAIQFHELVGDVNCYFKNKNSWIKGRYLLTVDWYTENDLLHLILLENGQLCFLPHHKIKFKNDVLSFPPYKKMRREWKV